MSDVIGLITARGGSKGIPRKNISTVAGKPLIAWTIEAALASPSVDRVIVSTDDDEIAQVSSQYGAEVPFIRPAALAQDDSPHVDVLVHTLEWLRDHESYFPDFLMLLQPTSPLRIPEDIESTIEIANRVNADCVVSVKRAQANPHTTLLIAEDKKLQSFIVDSAGYPRRQVLPKHYALNGAIYLIRADVFLEEGTLYPDLTYVYVMPPERSLDIDESWDLYLANLILLDRYQSLD